jgi:microcystin-dependent protein
MGYSPQGAGGGQAIPAGGIIAWAGLIANIPSGYVICDGNNGTPNLLARFIRQVQTAVTNPGTTGGVDSETLTSAEMAAHTHTYSRGTSWQAFATGSTNSWVNTTGATSGSAGSGSSHENRPAYYELAFIMKT